MSYEEMLEALTAEWFGELSDEEREIWSEADHAQVA